MPACKRTAFVLKLMGILALTGILAQGGNVFFETPSLGNNTQIVSWDVGSEYEWQDATESMSGTTISTLRQTKIVITEGHFLWAIGGKIEDQYCLDDTTVYRIDEDKWYQMSPMPYAVQSAGWTLYENKIYAFGGANVNHTESWAYVQVYDIKNDEWTLLDNMPAPRDKLSKFYPVVDNRYVYIFGGDTSVDYLINYLRDHPEENGLGRYNLTPIDNVLEYLENTPSQYVRTNWNWRYDLETGTWDTTVANAPYNQTFAVATYENGWIYYTTGNTGFRNHNSYPGALNQRYNPHTDEWQVMTPCPVPVTDGAGDKWMGELHIIGGWNTNQEYYNKNKDYYHGPAEQLHFIYNYENDSWRYAPDLPGNWHHQGVKAAENYLWNYLGQSRPSVNNIFYWDGENWIKKTRGPVAKMNFGTIYTRIGPKAVDSYGKLVLAYENVQGFSTTTNEGTWTSKIHDFGTIRSADRLEFAASVEVGENLWGKIGVDNNGDGTIGDTTGWTLLNDMNGVWGLLELNSGYGFQVSFKLETRENSHSPVIDSWALWVETPVPEPEFAVENLSPDNNAEVYEQTLLFVWQPSSDEFGIDHYEVWLDGVNVENVRATSYEASGLSGGQHEWYVVAVDPSGNSRASDVFMFTVKVAEFQLSNLSVSPESVAPGEPVTVSVGVANFGEVAGPHTLELRVDDELVDSQTVTLGLGQSATITFTVSSSESGIHTVSVDGLTGSFEVLTEGEGVPVWPVIVVIAIVLAAIAGVLVLRR